MVLSVNCRSDARSPGRLVDSMDETLWDSIWIGVVRMVANEVVCGESGVVVCIGDTTRCGVLLSLR